MVEVVFGLLLIEIFKNMDFFKEKRILLQCSCKFYRLFYIRISMDTCVTFSCLLLLLQRCMCRHIWVFATFWQKILQTFCKLNVFVAFPVLFL